MAIYHFTVKMIQRSKGKNVVAAAAYRHATRMHAEKEGVTFDYSNKPDVIHSEILIPENPPEWLLSLTGNTVNTENKKNKEIDVNQASEKLWNLVERVEKRKDAQLARELEFALPIELDQSQNLTLVREFIQDQFVLRGMIADFSIHWDEGNPHAHVLLSTREITAEGFGQKVTAWNDRQLLQEWREKWADYTNFHLRLHQHTVRVDHRSYAELNIGLLPGVHQGKAVMDMERRGQSTDLMKEANFIRQENLVRIQRDPEILLKKMVLQNESFTLQDVGQELGRYINDQGRFSIVFSIVEKGILAGNGLSRLTDEIAALEVLSPEVIANILTTIEQHDSVFTDKELTKALAAHTNNAELFVQAVAQIKSSPSLLALGPGDDGRERFTTRKMFELENSIQSYADRLNHHSPIKIALSVIKKELNHYQAKTGKRLTLEQLNAVKHVLSGSSISCIVGRAGTGKSFSLGAAKAVWESQGLRVMGVALSGIAADGMSKEAKIESRTIESFRYGLTKGTIELNRQTVVVMDEAGMTDSHAMHAVLAAVEKAQAKVVLVGDHAQIQPVGPGASFRALLERLGFAELHTIYRQKESWQREATVAFSKGDVACALGAYSDHHCIHLGKNPTEAKFALIHDWFSRRELGSTDLSQYLVVAHRNEDVDELNQLLRNERVARQEISEGYSVSSQKGMIKIAEGDRLLFLKNDRLLGVSNGRFATIQSVSFTETGQVIGFKVKLDGSGKEVHINPHEYQDFALGYAATVHKVQGITVDHALVYADGWGWNRHLIYVAMSRHRNTCHLYAHQAAYAEEKVLIKNLSRLGIKDSLLDYPLAFAKRRGLETSRLLKFLPDHLATRLQMIKTTLTEQYHQYNQYDQYLNPKRYRERQAEKKRLTDAETQSITRQEAKTVAAYMDMKKALYHASQALQNKLSFWGFDSLYSDPTAFSAFSSFSFISTTEEYRVLQRLINERNALAHHIATSSHRYQQAIKIYDIDLTILTKQSAHHCGLLRAQQYAQFKSQGIVVHRDRLAAELCSTIKQVYPHLKALNIDSKQLKDEAQAHLRRRLLFTLTPEERAHFHTVTHYQKKNQAIGVYYNEHVKDKKIVQRTQVLELEKMRNERDALAYTIANDRETFSPGLDFYQIGVAISHFQLSTKEDQKSAEKRWYQLQQYAARHELKDRMTRYFTAQKKGLMTERLKLAVEIRQETRGHYAAMRQLGIRPDQDFWLQIWKDEQRYFQLAHFKTLDLEERASFLAVEDYVKAKYAHATAWRELFESKHVSKHVQQMDATNFYHHLSEFAKEYTQARNRLADVIHQHPAFYASSLAYFNININIEELRPQAYAHQCQTRVEQFVSSQSVLERAKAALAIIQDPKAHYPAIVTHQLPWKDIYSAARIAERQVLFSQATLEEKSLLRLLDAYRTVNQEVGKLYGKKKNKHKMNEMKDKLQSLIVRRDAYAHRILALKEKSSIMNFYTSYQATLIVNTFIQKNQFHWDKMTKHAQCHRAKQQEINTWYEDYETSMTQLKNTVMTDTDSLKKKQNSMNSLLDWVTERQDRGLDTLARKIIAEGKNYQAVLHEKGISLEYFKQQQIAVEKIKLSLSQWLDTRYQHTKPSFSSFSSLCSSPCSLESLEGQSRLNAVRKMIQGAIPVKNTLAEHYLRDHRGITHALNEKTFLYHLHLKNWVTQTYHPALLVLARDSQQKVCGLQAIFLDPVTAKKASLDHATKLSRGFTSEGALIHQGLPNGQVAFVEGPETALSIAEAKPDWTVYCTFGASNFDKVPLKAQSQPVILCMDNDGLASGINETIQKAAEKLSQQGIDVWVSLPIKPSHAKKWDFNDVLLHQTKEHLSAQLDKSQLYQSGVTAERLENNIMQTLSNLSHKKDAEARLIEAPKISLIKLYDMHSIIKQYVEMEIKQTQLVKDMHAAKFNEPQLSKNLSLEATKHHQKMIKFANEAVIHPDIALEIQTLKNIRPQTLAKRGGYTEIQARIEKNELTAEDQQTVIAQIRNRSLSLVRTEQQDRSRGGRVH